MNKNQVVNSLKKWFSSFDFDGAKNRCQVEAQTRVLLIEPVISALGYDTQHWTTEALADIGGRRHKKIDYAIMPNGKDTSIVVEAKHIDNSLGHKVFGQLSAYFTNISEARIGISTNGIQWKFYTGDGSKDKLFEEPFFEFNVLNYSESDIEGLSRFHISLFKAADIQRQAEEIFLLSKFDQALFDELSSPSEAFISSIIKRMGYERSTKSRVEFVKNSINYLSLKDAYDRIIDSGNLSPDNGIITTEEEQRAFQAVKTIIGASSRKLANSLNRLAVRDSKGQFSILFDDNIRQPVCSFKLDGTKKKIRVGKGDYIEISSLDDIISFKSEIVSEFKDLINP